MPQQAIEWEYIETAKCLWVGKTKGLLCHFQFEISLTGRAPNEYLVLPNTRKIPATISYSLEEAKERAQELLNCYDISLSIL